MGGNFLGAHTLEALNVIESLVGNPPIDEIKTDVTLEHVLDRLDTVEKNIINVLKKNELDKMLIDHVYKLDGSIKNISKRVKAVETMKASENQPSRIDKIEEVIETLGSTLSSLKIKKGEATVGKKSKFIYVPQNPNLNPTHPSMKREVQKLQKRFQV